MHPNREWPSIESGGLAELLIRSSHLFTKRHAAGRRVRNDQAEATNALVKKKSTAPGRRHKEEKKHASLITQPR